MMKQVSLYSATVGGLYVFYNDESKRFSLSKVNKFHFGTKKQAYAIANRVRGNSYKPIRISLDLVWRNEQD